MAERLEDVLVARGLLSPERAVEGLRDHALGGGQLDTVFLELGGLSEQELLGALSAASGVQPLHLGDYEPNPAVAGEMPADVALRIEVVPVSLDGSTLHVASAYPVPQLELEAFGALRHRRIVPWVAISARVRDWLSALYAHPMPAREAAVLAALEPHRPLPWPARIPTEPGGFDEGLTLEELLAREILGEPVPERAEPSGPSDAVADPRGSTAQETPGAETPAAPEEPLDWPPPDRAKTEREFPMMGTSAAPNRPAPDRARTQREFPMMGTSAFPLAPPAPAAPPLQSELVVDWTLDEARSALRAVSSDRDGIKDVTLRYGRRTFDQVAAFAVLRGKAVGWDAKGDGADRARLAQVSVPMDVPSLFRTVALSHAGYAGPVPLDPVTRDILQKMRRAPRTVFLHPVELKGRLVALIYGDRAGKPVSQRRLAEFRLFCQELSGAFAELLVHRRQLKTSERAPSPGPAEPPAPIPPPARPAPLAMAPPGRSAPSTGGLGWSPGFRPGPGPLGRASTRPGPGQAEEARPPPDFQPLLDRLVGPDPALRARAMAELARTPEPAARVLARSFPGPTAWSRLPVQELPDPDELGPIPGALVRLGRSGASALAPLLDAPSADTRYFALLTAGSLPFPELVPGVLRGIFDLQPDLSSAARLSARALRRLPRFDVAMPSLRQELAARDPMRRILAARVLGALRDRQAVEGLVGLTGSDDALCAEAAADALAEITRASFGTTTRAWVAWWAENRRRSRSQWLIAALRHPDLAMRRAAAEELAAAMGGTLGYAAEAPVTVREQAVQRWEMALPDPRLRTLD